MISKPRARFELLETLANESGCTLCFLSTRAANRYIEAILYESVTDVEVREKLRQARGMCNFHAWQMADKFESLGVALIYLDLVHFYQDALKEARAGLPGQSLLKGLTDRLGASRRSKATSALARRLLPERGCTACEMREIAGQIYIEALLECLDEACPLLRESAGFCLPHLARIADQAAGQRDLDRLIEAQAEPLRRIEHELAEYVRKNDYRFTKEGLGSERDSWTRAIELLSGRLGAH